MIQLENETNFLLLSITKKCETLIKQTHTNSQETLELKLTQPRKLFSIEPSINFGLDSKWMIGLTILEVYSSIFHITEENTKSELYSDTFVDEVSYAQLKYGVADLVGLSDISSEDLQHEKHWPNKNKV